MTVAHEEIIHCNDPSTGLRAIVAIYSTALGPALGGTRFFPYSSIPAALADVGDLATAMAYKSAVAGLDHGGGKAVIIGDPRRRKSTALLHAYGSFVESLGGRYITAADVGTNEHDLDTIAERTRYATGRSRERGGAGDSVEQTALGVYHGMRAAAEHRWGSPTLAGRRVAIVGVGKVGARLAGLLSADGASVVVSDISTEALAATVRSWPDVSVLPPDRMLTEPCDVLAPCALGHLITSDVAAHLQAEIVCGAANNQLADDAAGLALAVRGVLYAPDYVVNAGGLIAVADEWSRRNDPSGPLPYSDERANLGVVKIYDTTARVLEEARTSGERPEQAANRMAEARMGKARREGYLASSSSA